MSDANLKIPSGLHLNIIYNFQNRINNKCK